MPYRTAIHILVNPGMSKLVRLPPERARAVLLYEPFVSGLVYYAGEPNKDLYFLSAVKNVLWDIRAAVRNKIRESKHDWQ